MIVSLERDCYLGPACVTRADGERLNVQWPDGDPVSAICALALPYQPAEGDQVLVVSQGEDCYIIGVLTGTGKTTLQAPGDLELSAPMGRVSITASGGVDVVSPEVRLSAGRLEIFAETLLQTFTSAAQWVKKTFFLRTGKTQQIVDGDYHLLAERIKEQAAGDVRIDGEKIHLG